MAKFEIQESYSWVSPEFRTTDFGKDSIKIRGKALCKGVISKNKRKYVEEELKKSARTLEGKLVTINHAPYENTHPNYDSRKIAGRVVDAEYEDNCIEYTAVIKRQPYVDLIRNRSAEIRGVSVEAQYLRNRCVKCGKYFYSEEEFRDHMAREHFIKVPIKEVHGIHFRALSLVLAPEVPGVEGANLEVWETVQPEKKGALRLLETVTTVKMEEEKIAKELKEKLKKPNIALRKDSKITVDKARKLREQEEPIEPGSQYCETHPDDPRCKEHKKAIHGEEILEAEYPWDQCISDRQADGYSLERAQKICAAIKNRTIKHTMEYEKLNVKEAIKFIAEKIDKDKIFSYNLGKAVEQLTQGEPSVTTVSTSTCPEGFEDDGEGGCKAKPIEAQTPETPAPLMVPEPTIEPPKTTVTTPAPAQTTGPVIEQAEDGQLPAAPFPTAPSEAPAELTKPCPEGSHEEVVDGYPVCVPDEILAEPAKETKAKLAELTLPAKLKLGEPFADYKDFDDCVAKNRGKADDPEAYCATIKRQTEGETVKETLKPAFEMIPSLKEIDAQSYRRDSKIATSLNMLNEATAKLHNLQQTMATETNKFRITEAKLRTRDTKMLKEGVNKFAEAVNKNMLSREANNKVSHATFNRQFATLNETMNKNTEYFANRDKQITETINKSIKYFTDKLGQLATANSKLRGEVVSLNNQVKEQKGDYEKILTAADKKLEEYQGKIKSLEQRLKEQEEEAEKHKCGPDEHWDESQGKCVKNAPPPETEETKKLKETVQQLQANVDNLMEARKGEFKGKNKPLTSTSETSSSRPDKIMRETAKRR